MGAAHYRVGWKGKYLRVHADGSREWVDNIADATTWPTAAEAVAVARSLQVTR